MDRIESEKKTVGMMLYHPIEAIRHLIRENF